MPATGRSQEDRVTDTTRPTGQNQATGQDVQSQRKLNDRFNGIADGLTTYLVSLPRR